jgi:hypothetical protein
MLPSSIALQRFESISGRCRQVLQFLRDMKEPKLSQSDPLDRSKLSAPLAVEETLGFSIAEALDHY